MRKICKKEQSINRQKDIEKVFLGLLLKKDYEDITICEICQVANIPRKAFYRYFECKESLLNSLILHTLQAYPAFKVGFVAEKRNIISELKDFFEFWLCEPQNSLIKVLMKNDFESLLLSHSLSFPTQFMDLDKFFPNETPKHRSHILKFAITGLMTLMFDWLKDGCKESTLEMANIARRMLEQPLFPNLSSMGF